MRRITVVALLPMFLVFAARLAAGEELPRPLVTGLKDPQAVAVAADGRIYIAVRGEGEKAAGAVLVLDEGKAVPFATGLDAPSGIVTWNEWLFVAGQKQIWRIDRKGKAEVFAAERAFPFAPRSLRHLTVDEDGWLYVAAAHDTQKPDSVVYRIDPRGRVTLITDAKRLSDLKAPGGMLMDGKSFLLLADSPSGKLLRVNVAEGTGVPIADNLGVDAGLAWDRYGRLYFGSREAGAISVVPRPGERPVPFAAGFQGALSLCLDPSGKSLLVLDRKAGTLTALPAGVPGQPVDESPMPVKAALAFPDLKWAGWKPENDKGQLVPLRPLVLTHAGDGSNRVFVATEHGVIHVFPNDQKAKQTQVFLDIQDRVVYDDNQNEEGFLGLAFHPRYKQNGEFFVFYTQKKKKLVNVLSRFRVRPDDPNRADPASEEVLLEIKKPFWNHDGGTICFGPDGYLYVAHGDGGAANDPFDNGQNLNTLLGKILRVDVDHKDEGKAYAVPKDNPFVGRANARPEIWAYGLRNVWRMAFDRKTGELWAADVGQNLYEEIDLIVKGGNYGWNLREGLHPFGRKGVGPRADLIDPIWEYHHDLGKSLTGGVVYRGKRLPDLFGMYLCADYVSTKVWAVRYDPRQKRVVAFRPIRDPNVPVLSFGEDEQGEVYFMTYTPTGQGIYWFERAKDGAGKK